MIIGLPDCTNLVDKRPQFTDKYHIFRENSITILRQVKQM
jgi:hypothetical protein